MRISCYIFLILLCITVEPARRRRTHFKTIFTSPLDNFVNRLDDHNYWLQTQLKKEKSTINEVANYPNDDESNTFQSMNKNEQQMSLHYMKLAQQNVDNVLETGKCTLPSRRCLDMHRINSGTVKSYWPPCALVHKCEHDSGCCIAQGHVCSPIDTKPIDLHFFSFTPKEHGKKRRGRVERFTFENHTECGCRPASVTSSLRLWGDDENDQNTPFDNSSCRCPKHFVPSDTHDKCVCVCRKKMTRVCRRIIKGKRSYHSTGCKGDCDLPICEYGEYKSDFGRCPRKSERIRRK